MTAGSRDRISGVYHAALALAPEERAAFLNEACGGNEALRHEVESLLRYESASARFLEAPAANVTAGAPDGTQILNRQLAAQSWPNSAK